MKLISKLFLLFALLLLLACRQQAPAEAPILFRVDGRGVTLQQFQQEFNRSLPAGRVLSADERAELQRAFLVQAIDRELTLGEAERLGLQLTAEEIETSLAETRHDYDDASFQAMLQDRGLTLDALRQELASNLLMEKVMQKAALSGVEVAESDIEAYYREHQDEFDRPAQVRVRQIVLADEDQARQVLGRLRQGESFAELAKAHSLFPDGEEGGDLGFFARGEMPPEFDAVVFDLPVGRLSEPVTSPYGVHIFQVEERRQARQLKLAEAAPEIRALLLREAEEQAYLRWLQELRARAVIDINMDLLNAPNS